MEIEDKRRGTLRQSGKSALMTIVFSTFLSLFSGKIKRHIKIIRHIHVRLGALTEYILIHASEHYCQNRCQF